MFFRKSTQKNGQKNAKNGQKYLKNDQILDPPEITHVPYVHSSNFFVRQYFYMILSPKIVFCPRFYVFRCFNSFSNFLRKKMENTDFAIFGLFFFCCFFFRFSKIQKNLLYKNLKKFSKSQKSKIWVFRTILVKISTEKSI